MRIQPKSVHNKHTFKFTDEDESGIVSRSVMLVMMVVWDVGRMVVVTWVIVIRSWKKKPRNLQEIDSVPVNGTKQVLIFVEEILVLLIIRSSDRKRNDLSFLPLKF